MRIILSAFALTALALPAAAQIAPKPARPAPILTTPDARDVWTRAQPQIARVTHVDVDLTADFASKTMRGTATLDILAARGAREIILDIDDLDIASITDAKGRKLPYTVGAD